MTGPNGETGITVILHGLSGWIVAVLWILMILGSIAFAYYMGRQDGKWHEEQRQWDEANDKFKDEETA